MALAGVEQPMTPEERREAHLVAIRNEIRASGNRDVWTSSMEIVYATLLNVLEPVVADAVRYGLEPVSTSNGVVTFYYIPVPPPYLVGEET